MNEWLQALQSLTRLFNYDPSQLPELCARDAKQRESWLSAYETAISEELIKPIEQLSKEDKTAIWSEACRIGEYLQQSERIELSKIIHVKTIL